MHGILILGISILIGCLTTDAASISKYADSKISRIIAAPSLDQQQSLPSQPIAKANSNINSISIDNHDVKSHHDHHSKKLTNHEILSSLGLVKVNIPASHHRKRLAVESRHHARPDDSRMFIVKLPPNPVYYTNLRSAHDQNSIEDKNKKTVNFKLNGKPGRIYHWNLPTIQKMFSHDGKDSIAMKRHSTNRKHLDYDIVDIKHIPTWSKPWENETIDKGDRKTQRQHMENQLYMPSMKKPFVRLLDQQRFKDTKKTKAIAKNKQKHNSNNYKIKSVNGVDWRN